MRAGRGLTVVLKRAKDPICELQVQGPRRGSKTWTYRAGNGSLAFGFRPTRSTAPGVWTLAATCVARGTATSHRYSTQFKVVTGRRGKAFLVGKSGPDWTVLVAAHSIHVSATPPLGGKGGDPGNDYPYQNRVQDSGVDPWGEDFRECTSFVAWALSSRNQFTMPFSGNAYQWGNEARARGYAVDNTPAVGAVAWEPQLPNHYWGHVMWVSAVNGSSVTIEEYNEHGNGTYDTRTYSLGSEPYQYIHFKDLTYSPPTTPTPTPPTSPPASSTYTESAGSVTRSWTNYSNAGGTEGPSIGSGQGVQVACKVTGLGVSDGNTWWYQIASSPWNDSYYASADAFYNNGQTSGSLHGTPFVDANVPNCSSGGSSPPPATTYSETPGTVTHSWTDYSDAGGTQGPSLPSNQTVQVACRVTGLAVADGNNWWYRIASSPWNSGFYASADAFYNNGETSGSLHGTPFVDTNVPNC